MTVELKVIVSWGLEPGALGHWESGKCQVHSGQEEGGVLGESTEQRDNPGDWWQKVDRSQSTRSLECQLKV